MTMMIYKPHNKLFYSRKDLKKYLGGTNKYNNALKNGDIYNIYLEEMSNQSFAHNGVIYNTDKRNS